MGPMILLHRTDFSVVSPQRLASAMLRGRVNRAGRGGGFLNERCADLPSEAFGPARCSASGSLQVCWTNRYSSLFPWHYQGCVRRSAAAARGEGRISDKAVR